MPQKNSEVAPARFFYRLPPTDYRLLLPLIFGLMLVLSWRRWTSLLVDTGREMDLPLRLLRGELLYRDVHFLYPPFAPYFNALLYQIFGVQLATLNIAGVICAVLIVALCWAIARRILPPREAVLATVAVIVWCIFKPEGNLIAPYSFSALHGMIFALATLVTTLRYNERKSWTEMIAAGIWIGMAGITKQEFALTAAVTWSAGILFLHRKDWRKLTSGILLPAAISLLIVVPVYGYFLSRVGWQILIEDCHLLYTRIPPALVFYNSARTGLDHPFASVLQMIGGALVAWVIALFILMIRSFKQGIKVWLNLISLVVLPLLVIVVIAKNSHGRWDGSPLRALPFALLGLMLVHFFRKDETKPQFALFVIAVYSLMAVLRVVLRVPSGGAFGGYFLPTSLIIIVYLLTVALPNLRQSSAEETTRLKKISSGFLGICVLATIFVFGYRYRKTFPVLITAPRGSLYVTQATAQATQEMIDFLRENAQPNDAVAVVPEGSSLAFLTGHPMPLRHQILIPDFMDAAEEQRTIAALQTTKFVLVVNRPMREFGREAFGRDYYQAMGRELENNFRVVKICGAVQDENIQIGHPKFFIKILARK